MRRILSRKMSEEAGLITPRVATAAKPQPASKRLARHKQHANTGGGGKRGGKARKGLLAMASAGLAELSAAKRQRLKDGDQAGCGVNESSSSLTKVAAPPSPPATTEMAKAIESAVAVAKSGASAISASMDEDVLFGDGPGATSAHDQIGSGPVQDGDGDEGGRARSPRSAMLPRRAPSECALRRGAAFRR